MENARPFSFWTGLTLLDITFCVVGGWVSYNKAAHSALLKSSKQYNADCLCRRFDIIMQRQRRGNDTLRRQRSYHATVTWSVEHCH